MKKENALKLAAEGKYFSGKEVSMNQLFFRVLSHQQDISKLFPKMTYFLVAYNKLHIINVTNFKKMALKFSIYLTIYLYFAVNA